MGVAAFMPWIKKTLLAIFFVFGVLMIAQSLGANVGAFLTGLGIGGLAFALAAQDTLGRVLRPFLDEEFEAFEPDLIFRDGFSLEPHGVKGKVLATPGHTPGSASVVLASGEAIIGDVLRGSLVWPNKSRQHWFCYDPESNNRSIIRLAREGLLRCHPGVFGSFPGTELGQYLSTDRGGVMQLSGEPV